MLDLSLFDPEDYHELRGAWRYESARVDWLREVLRWRFPVPKLPARWRDNWRCNLCAIDNGSRKATCASCGLPKGAFEGGDSSKWLRFNPEDWIPGCVLPRREEEAPAAEGHSGESDTSPWGDASSKVPEPLGGGGGGGPHGDPSWAWGADGGRGTGRGDCVDAAELIFAYGGDY